MERAAEPMFECYTLEIRAHPFDILDFYVQQFKVAVSKHDCYKPIQKSNIPSVSIFVVTTEA